MKKILCMLSALLVFASLFTMSCGSSSADNAQYIGIISPSSCINSSDIDAGVEILKSHDFSVKLGENVYEIYGYLAGTDQQRADDINKMFSDDEVKAILCTRGGYGSARVLEKLDYDMIAKNPKPLIGFSDITALHIVLGERCNTPTFHAPMLVSLVRDSMKSDYTLNQFFAGLNGEIISGEIPMPEGKKLETVIPGHAEGVIRGGNLTVLASLVGTPYELKGDGALLLIEEVGEKPYRIDRMLNQLSQSGLFERVNGILLGDFVNCETVSADSMYFQLNDILTHYAEISGKPVIRGVPAGHDADNMYLPLGVNAVMNADTNGTASLIISGK